MIMVEYKRLLSTVLMSHLIYTYQQSFSEFIETTAKHGVFPVAISNVKLF